MASHPAGASELQLALKRHRAAGVLVWSFGALALVGFLHRGIRGESAKAAPLSSVMESLTEETLPEGQPVAVPSRLGSDLTSELATHLRGVVQSASKAEGLARRTLNPAPLATYYAGAALQEELAALNSQNPNEEVVSVLQGQTFGKVSLLGPNQAQVELVERWITTVYQRGTGDCLAHFPLHAAPQTARLQRLDGVWKVVKVSFQDDPGAPEAPCPR